MRGNICYDLFFSSCHHNIYILIVTRLFKLYDSIRFKIWDPSCFRYNLQSGKPFFHICERLQLIYDKIGGFDIESQLLTLTDFHFSNNFPCIPVYVHETDLKAYSQVWNKFGNWKFFINNEKMLFISP